MSDDDHLFATSEVFAPTYPRQAADDGAIQRRRTNRFAFVNALAAANDAGMPGYYSVYAYPRGHSKHGNIPEVDCVFIDFDVIGTHYEPDRGFDDVQAWRADMSALLARTRMVADAIIENDREQHFRAALSGHKGIHLYLDFPTVSPLTGSFQQFKNGLRRFADGLVDTLDHQAGGIDIKPWMDVDGSDLGRLARHPNTRHHQVAYTDNPRWCVPVTMRELADLDVDGYIALTSEPRQLPDACRRVPSEQSHERVVQYILAAEDATTSGDFQAAMRTKSDRQALDDYRDRQNDDIELADVLFLTSNKPCFEAFRERDDAYQHGEASRTMELSIMGRLLDMEVPLDVIHAFFEPIPGYDEQITNDILADLLARNNQYGEFRCTTIAGGVDEAGETVAGSAPQFCLGSDCGLYRRFDDIQLPDDR